MGWEVENEPSIEKRELEQGNFANQVDVRYYTKKQLKQAQKHIKEFLKGREQLRIIRQKGQLMIQDATGVDIGQRDKG